MTRHGSSRHGLARRSKRDDSGVAAVEFALVFGLLLSVTAAVWPLGNALLQKMALDRAMSDVIRYATATPDSPEYDPDGTVDNPTDSRRPTCTQVTNEFYRAANVSTADRSDYSITIPTCPSATAAGQTVTITVSRTAGLGPLGDLLSIVGITHSSTVTVSAAASGREE